MLQKNNYLIFHRFQDYAQRFYNMNLNLNRVKIHNL